MVLIIKDIGWIITGMLSYCGIAAEAQTIFIIPNDDIYYAFVVKSKFDPIVVDVNKDTLSIWYSYQEWGGGGTGLSYFVPRKINVFKSDFWYIEIGRGNILNGIEKLKNSNAELRFDYVNLFTAAIIDVNPKLLEYAYSQYYKDKDEPFYLHHNLPTTKKEIDEIILELEKLNMINLELEKFGFSNELPDFGN